MIELIVIIVVFGIFQTCFLKCCLEKIMTSVEELKNSLDGIQSIVTNVKGDVESLIAQVAVLAAEVAAGKIATQEDLDALGAKAQGIKDSLGAVDAQVPALELPALEVVVDSSVPTDPVE